MAWRRGRTRAVLIHLGQHGPLTSAQLATQLDMSPRAVEAALERLEHSGEAWSHRHEDPPRRWNATFVYFPEDHQGHRDRWLTTSCACLLAVGAMLFVIALCFAAAWVASAVGR